MSLRRFTIERQYWYAWHMFPGYGNLPYLSPIFVTKVELLKSGQRIFELEFLNVGYAAGVQDFSLRLRTMRRASNYIVVDLKPSYPDDVFSSDRTAIISQISDDWMINIWPNTCLPNGYDIQDRLTKLFRGNTLLPNDSP